MTSDQRSAHVPRRPAVWRPPPPHGPWPYSGRRSTTPSRRRSPSALRITDLKCGYVRGSLFVKIHTNQGIWGCGEGVDAIGGTYNLVQSFGQRLRGQNPLNVHRLFEQLRKGGVFGGAQAGVFVAVLSAVETALWDLAGKALNVPVYQLLGGKFRDRSGSTATRRSIRRGCPRRICSPRRRRRPSRTAIPRSSSTWIRPPIPTSTISSTGRRARRKCSAWSIS